jgi:WD40 repeat protein
VKHIRQNRKDISAVLSLTSGRETFASTHADGTVRQWTVGNGSYELLKQVRLERLKGPHTVSFIGRYSEEKVLIASDKLRPIVVELNHEPDTNYTPWMIGCDPYDDPVFFHQGSKIIFTKTVHNDTEILSLGEDGSINIWNFNGRREQCWKDSGFVWQCTCAELSPTGDILAIAGSWKENDKQTEEGICTGIVLVDLKSPLETWAKVSLNCPMNESVTALCFDRTGRQLFFSTSASEYAVWGMYTLPTLGTRSVGYHNLSGTQRFDVSTSSCMRVSPDNRILAIAQPNGGVKFLFDKNNDPRFFD